MTHKLRIALTAICFAIAPVVSKADSADAAAATLDKTWLQVRNSWTTERMTSSTLSPDLQAVVKQGRIKAFLDAAAQAADFAAKNPSHAKARWAKKVEALATLDAAEAGAVEQEPRALRLGVVYRNDKSNAEDDRFEVAARMMDYNIVKQNLAPDQILKEYEKKADGLVAEFPTNAGAYGIYIGVMRFSGIDKVRQVAKKVLLAPAPAAVKAQAQDILDRANLVGQEGQLEFTTTNGNLFRSEKKAGSIIVLYVWTAQTTDLDNIFSAVTSGANGATLIGVNIDQDIKAATDAVQKFMAPGDQYVDGRGLKSPLARQLRVQDVPSVYVFGRDTRLVGFGSLGDLPALVAAAQ
jgi:hypothetical protein